MKWYAGMSLFLVLILLIIEGEGTQVRNCPKSKSNPISSVVTISSCPKNKCILKRNTEANIEIKFAPERDFKELNSDIQGIILGVELPFPGYYGTSACPYIYDEAGENKIGCPLTAGKTYVYKNSFKILPIYPTVTLDIHWGLGDAEGDAICFEIPGKIKA